VTDVYRDTDERYRNDPAFHAAVTTLEIAATEHGFTPGELKQIAFKAALNLEMRKLPSMIVLSELRPGEEPKSLERLIEVKNRIDRKIHAGLDHIARAVEASEVAGYLKDGTPVFFGRTP